MNKSNICSLWRRALCAVISLSIGFSVSADLKVYPEGRTNMPHNDDFTVRVRPQGADEWLDLFEYNVNVDMDRVTDASMVQFDMDSPVEVMVKKNNGNFSTVDIRPLDSGIKYVRRANTIMFTLDRPRYLSVEFDGDRLNNLHIFANPPESEVYESNVPGVMYFGPGVHRPSDLPNNTLRIPSNTTVYLAPGAVVKARLLVDKAENVRIIGRGILDHPMRGVEVTDSRNVEIDGITVVNPDHYTIFGGGAENLTVKNFKSFSCKGWSDGIDLMCCNNVNIDNIFMRNSDDCIAIYNHRWHWYGGTQNVNVTNAVLWADIAHPINIGGHGDDTNPEGEVIENVKFKNIDILEQDEDDPPYRGCMAIVVGDNNIARDITFENVRVESIQEGMLFNLCVMFNEKYNKTPGGSIYNVLFKNISYSGYGESSSVIKGYDAKHMIQDITFDNVTVNGAKIKSLSDFSTNQFISNIKFK